MDTNIGSIIGNLGKDPESKTLPSGTTVAQFSIASTSGWGDKKKTNWFDVKAFGKTAEFCAKYFYKGCRVAIEYRLEQETWQTKDGENRSKVVLVANNVQQLTFKDKGQSQDQQGAPAPQHGEEQAGEDDLAF